MAVVTLPAFTDAYLFDEVGIANKALLRIGADIIRDTDEDTKQMRACKSVYEVSRVELLRSFAFPFATKTAEVPEIDKGFTTEPYSYAYDVNDYFEFTGDVTPGSYDVTNVTFPADRAFSYDLIGRYVRSSNYNRKAQIVRFNESANTITLDTIFIPSNGTPDTGVYFFCVLPVLRILEVNSKKDSVYEIMQSGTGPLLLTDEIGRNDSEKKWIPIKYTADIRDPSLFDALFTDLLILKIAIKIAMSMSQKPASIVSVLQQEYGMNLRLAISAATSECQTDVPDTPWTKLPIDKR